MNKLVIVLVAGYLLGNDKARYEVNKLLKLGTTKTIDALTKMKNGEDDPDDGDKLSASTTEIL